MYYIYLIETYSKQLQTNLCTFKNQDSLIPKFCGVIGFKVLSKS